MSILLSRLKVSTLSTNEVHFSQSLKVYWKYTELLPGQLQYTEIKI